jgi:hypothetical protein
VTIYLLKIWGNLHSVYSSHDAAHARGVEIREPTSESSKYYHCAFTIECWGEDVGRIDYWNEEFRVSKKEIDG